MTTKHTEGKWINSGGYVQALYQDSPKTFFHTIANCNQNLVSPAKTEANARLIAAAPELLEALEWAVKNLGDDLDPDFQTAKTHCELIVKKAKGES